VQFLVLKVKNKMLRYRKKESCLPGEDENLNFSKLNRKRCFLNVSM